MNRDDWQKKFREGFTGNKEAPKKKYEEMSPEEKEKYLREKNKKQSFSGFADGGIGYDDVQTNALLDKVRSNNMFQSPVLDEQDKINAELAQVNEVAKNPFMETEPERVEDVIQQEAQKTPVGQAIEGKEPASDFNALSELKANIERQKALMNKPQESSWTDSLPDILAAAHNLSNYKGGSQQKMLDVNYKDKLDAKKSASNKDKQSEIKNLQDMYTKYMEMQAKSQPKTLSALDEAKLVKLKKENENTVKPLSFEEKERKKAEIKDEIIVKKENRKLKTEAEKALEDVDKQIGLVEKAIDEVNRNEKDSLLFDTGRFDDLLPTTSTSGQKLEQSLNDLSLQKMAKLFEGMSKSIDSDAERAFFNKAQASMSNNPETNRKVLKEMMLNLQSLKNKTSNKISELSGDSKKKSSAPQGEIVERNGKRYKWNPSVGKYQLY